MFLGKPFEQQRVWPGSETSKVATKPSLSTPSTWTSAWAEAVREVSVCEKDTELLLASFQLRQR